MKNTEMRNPHVFKGVQYEVNRRTGESLGFDERNIRALSEYAQDHPDKIWYWAAIRHDKDAGKGPHWHMCIWTDGTLSSLDLGRIVGIPDYMILYHQLIQPVYYHNVWDPELMGSRTETDAEAFADYARYLTHERQYDKALYSRDEVICNFNYDDVWNDGEQYDTRRTDEYR